MSKSYGLSDISRLVRLGLPRSKSFKLGLLVAALQSISAVALLATSAWLISRAAEMPPVLFLQLAVVGVRGFALGRAFFRYVERLLLHDAAFRQLEQLRPRVFSALIPLAPAGFGSLKSGELLGRITSDVDELQFLPLRIVSPLIQSVAVTVLSIVGLAFLAPNASWVVAVTALLAFFVALPLAGWSARKTDTDTAGQRSDLSSEILKLFESLDEFRAFSWASPQLERISRAEQKLATSAKSSAWSQGVGQASFGALSMFATVGSAFFAAQAFANGQLQGVWIAVVTLLPLAIFDVLQGVHPVASAWQRYIVSAKRVAEVLDSPLPAFLREATPSKTVGLNGYAPFKSLELKSASISYGQNQLAVKNFNLTLKSGEVIALTGASGAGKSSIALVLAAFLKLDSGSYSFNHVDSASIDPEHLRTRVGYLQQHPTIFAGNVTANLRIAKPEASDAEMIAVLKTVSLWSMFEARQGLQTELAELGRAISGGEIARLALARALLVDFDVLIFDEPTANLDFQTASDLVTDLVALAKSREHRAVIIISHDADVISRAERVVTIS